MIRPMRPSSNGAVKAAFGNPEPGVRKGSCSAISSQVNQALGKSVAHHVKNAAIAKVSVLTI